MNYHYQLSLSITTVTINYHYQLPLSPSIIIINYHCHHQLPLSLPLSPHCPVLTTQAPLTTQLMDKSTYYTHTHTHIYIYIKNLNPVVYLIPKNYLFFTFSLTTPVRIVNIDYIYYKLIL